MLRRIQALTNEGVSLVGVRKVLELEDELASVTVRIRELEHSLEQASHDIAEAVERAHAEHRRDLVPVSRSMVRYRDRA